MKRGIEDEVNSLLQGKVLVNRGETDEVKSLRALKLGGLEGGNLLVNHVPQKVWRIKTKADQYYLCPGDIIIAHEVRGHPSIGSEEKNPLIHRLK